MSNTISNWLAGFLRANPSSMRPVIDLHHIELVLTWSVFLQAGRRDDLGNWMQILLNRLFMRRSGNAQIPFIEGRNSLDLIFEFTATGKKPPEFCDGSSVYLTCLMELMCSLPKDRRDELLPLVYQRVVLGRADCGTQMGGCEPIDLMLWIPPADWGERVLSKSLSDEGECVTIHFAQLGATEPSDGEEIAKVIETLVKDTRAKRNFQWPDGLPLSLMFLGCLKHRSPLPPELWRSVVFREHITELRP